MMEGSTSNSRNVPKKSTRLGRMLGFRQYTVRPRCEPKSLQLACTKFSNFVPILNTSIVPTPTFIISVLDMNLVDSNIFSREDINGRVLVEHSACDDTHLT